MIWLESLSLQTCEAVAAALARLGRVLEARSDPRAGLATNSNFTVARFRADALADTPWSPDRSTSSTACAKPGSRKNERGLLRRTARIPDIGHSYTPVGTDAEPVRGNGKRTDKRSMAGFDRLEAQRGPALRYGWESAEVEPREAAYPVIHYICAPCRKDWLSVRLRALVSSSDAAQMRS